MRNNSEYVNRGGTIQPSARPAIHPLPENMVSYGLKPANRTTNLAERVLDRSAETTEDDGRDEVDNVLSKPTKSFDHVSGTTQTYKTPPRRNSLVSKLNQDQTDDSEDDGLLAKSLPARLPSHSLYSSYIKDWSQDGSVNNWSRNTQDMSYGYIPESMRPPKIHTNLLNESRNTKQKKFSDYYLLICIFGIIIAIVMANYNDTISYFIGKNELTVYDATQFQRDINSLKGKYTISQDSILQVQIGIKTIFDREDTGSFIFVYNSNSQDFNYELFSDLLDNISHKAAKYLRNDSATVRHLVVESSELDMRTTSELINRYQDAVTKTGVMLVKEIDRVPSSLAMAFHYYCDEYNPLVKKSAIFFTLDLARCSNYLDSNSIHTNIEKCLSDKWSSVPTDNIKPLLTRVVSVVVDLTNTLLYN